MKTTKVCNRCGMNLSLGEFYTNGRNASGEVMYRPDCKLCNNASRRVPEESKRYANDPDDDIFRICRQLAQGAHARIFAPSRQHKASYRNLDDPYGFPTSREMTLFLYREFKTDIQSLIDGGLRPSVDRLDTSRGYTPGNIKVIDHTENTLRGVESIKRKVKVLHPDGQTTTYESVVACAEAFDTYDGHVRSWLRGKWRPKNGCTFTYEM